MPSPAKKPKSSLEKIILEIRQVYPELTTEELSTMILNIKKENNGTLKNLTMNHILDKVSEYISPGMCLNKYCISFTQQAQWTLNKIEKTFNGTFPG